MTVILCKDSHVLLHVFSLVDWPKPVKSGSGGCLEWCGDRINNRSNDRNHIRMSDAP